jgi:glutathione synthase/RimK-type ligase-like ATP-grasp enzyme
MNNYHNDCIIKPIKSGNMRDAEYPKVIFTSKLDSSIFNSKERIEAFPLFIQRNIHKKYDLRCIVVGTEVFTAQIESQRNEESKIDWRKSESYLKHEKHILPLEIKEKCINLTQKLNLNYSAIDLVLDENENYVFLECNPNGQWAWLEKRLSFNISKSIVNLLINKGLN